MFADKVEIQVKAGNGGDGKMSFRHEKYRAMGGPDGGNGGRGGNVVFRVDHNMSTLSAYRTKRQIKAEHGEGGKGNASAGKAGEDFIVAVPMGTIVFEGESIVADLTKDGESVIIAHGGRGGFGNAHFVSSTRQAPRAAELGEPGELRQLVLELKLTADVGLVGLPNAGKSTLLSVVSNARPEIGDYPFTTLIPNLGVVDIDDESFLVADIPGLIEGASKGKGLGDEFLRHIERTAVLLHLIDTHNEDVVKDYLVIQKELKEYVVDLTQKPQIIALTKTEGMDKVQLKAIITNLTKAAQKDGEKEVFAISAQAHQNIDALLRALVPYVKKARIKREEQQEAAERVIIDETTQPDLWQVHREGDEFRVEGIKIEGFARRTNWDNDDSVERLRDILRKLGIARELERHKIERGDTVMIGPHKLTWL